jgi:hypothetical protein
MIPTTAGSRKESRTEPDEAECYNFLAKLRFQQRRFLNACIVGEWLSLVEHLVRDQGVGGSNPLSPTNLSLAHSVGYAAFAASD